MINRVSRDSKTDHEQKVSGISESDRKENSQVWNIL